MRTLSEARTLWINFKRYSTVDELKGDVRIVENGDPTGVKLRSAYWKVLLLFDSLDCSLWQSALSSSRSAYESLRSRFPHDKVEDEQLLVEIRQDVERCMPGIPFFQDASTQVILLNVLFVFCKLNPDLSYRQGMHELLAPVIWAIDRDAIDIGRHSKLMGEDALLSTLFSREYIEHDSFALFGQIMQNAKKFYEQTTHTAQENPLISRCQRIMSTLLPQIDPELAAHIERIGLAPQIFLIRWLRLLLGREFEFNDILTVWDVIFAEDASLEIIDHICLAMLLRIRWELLDASYNEALTVLMHYPPTGDDITAQMLAIDGLALRSNMTITTANRLVLKYTGRAMPAFNRPVTPPALQRNITSFSGMDAFRKSFRGASDNAVPQINFEALLQNTAQNIMNRGEQLGIGKAVRGAIDDVHRKAQEIRETSTTASSSWRQRPRSSHTLSAKLKALERRNAQLAQLLDGAVTQLWDLQKQIAEGKEQQEKPAAGIDLDKLSLAIGQVQYVQVYLQDSSLPLTEAGDAIEVGSQSEVTEEKSFIASAEPVVNSADQDPAEHAKPPLESRQSSVVVLQDPSEFDVAADEDTAQPVEPPEPTTPKQKSPPSRPPLSETKFSWMLGQPRESPLGAMKSHLNEAAEGAQADGAVSSPKIRKGIRPRKKYATQVVSTDTNLDFDA